MEKLTVKMAARKMERQNAVQEGSRTRRTAGKVAQMETGIRKTSERMLETGIGKISKMMLETRNTDGKLTGKE